MARQLAARAAFIEEVKPMHTEERVAKLESDVEHIRSDISDIKRDLREQRVESATRARELRAEIAALTLAFEKFKGSHRVLLAIIIVLQLVATGGVAGAFARAFNLL
ncbi:MAG TPA: hypothetical protein VG994_10755 [Steroidobacteraceae bacterium]|nr:hypothetical protein [Steroidobacteraceae bacterium]